MISQYNCFLFNEKNNIFIIIIFLPFENDESIIKLNSHEKFKSKEFLSEYLSEYEIAKYSNDTKIIYSNLPLTITDKIETFQYSILSVLNRLDDTIIDELYIFGMSNCDTRKETIFENLTNTEYIANDQLQTFLSNIEFSKSKEKLKKTKNDFYNFQEFSKLSFLKEFKREKIPLTIQNAKLKYVNPFKLLEDLDDKANKVNSFSIHNRPIHEIINVQDDKSVSLYACFFEDFIKQTTNKDLMSLYFPNINVTNR